MTQDLIVTEVAIPAIARAADLLLANGVSPGRLALGQSAEIALNEELAARLDDLPWMYRE